MPRRWMPGCVVARRRTGGRRPSAAFPCGCGATGKRRTSPALLAHRGPGARALVWAHNSHLGNAAATEMGRSGQTKLGEMCRAAFGRNAVLIGQSTDRGEVAAADNWDEPMQVKAVVPSRADSWERLFLRAGRPVALYDWRAAERAELREALRQSRLERAIGVRSEEHTSEPVTSASRMPSSA